MKVLERVGVFHHTKNAFIGILESFVRDISFEAGLMREGSHSSIVWRSDLLDDINMDGLPKDVKYVKFVE